MKDFASLKVLDRFSAVLEKFGCDYTVLRQILQVKLTMDSRRVPTVIGRNQRSRKGQDGDSDKNSFIRSLWIYGFMGLIAVPFVLMSQNYLFQMSIVFSILMFLITTSMISDFSSVLLDIRDQAIIGTKPVKKRTVSFARAIHITIYLIFLTGALTGPGLVAALIRHGPVFFLIFLLDVILMDIFVMVITALLYLLVLHFFDGERLKDIINYIQIILSLVIIIGYQLVGRSFQVFRLHIVFHAAWWQVLVAPFWFGSTFSWFGHGPITSQITTLSILAIVIPIILFSVYVRLMPVFENKLQKLSNNAVRHAKGIPWWIRAVSRVISGSHEETIFFRFGTLMMSKEREFKLKVYPSLGFSLVLPFIILINPALSGGLKGLASSKLYLSIYLSAFVIASVVMMLQYSGQYKAAWIYQTAPITNLSHAYRGTVKAFLVRLMMPIYLFESIVFVAVFGLRVIPQLVVVALALLLYTVICFVLLTKDLPFSQPFQVAQQRQTLIVFLLMFIMGAFAGIHYAFTLIPFGVYLYMAVLLILNYIGWHFGFNRLTVSLPSAAAKKE
ncbi:hypothetical protein [Alicyclobacillus sp. SO9]|uniref:hypothetical protein n=1 Tax=Alicyclobacillus sp. SO9 TaxID=2665646 RepID=UPI0018E77413|nr:hypothetical protein [Alicyclobacillus sp. SO9]QQE78277.1 hypothetical protein GI364_20735 [Alicyclobacillus sp. SO9]